MILQCLFGLTEVAATKEIASEGMVTASVPLTTNIWYEVLDTQLYLSCQCREYMMYS